MSAELWSAIASVATFFVIISATAIAAFVQLRHIRRSTELTGLLSTFEMLQGPLGARTGELRHDLPARMNDPGYCAGLLIIPIDRCEHLQPHRFVRTQWAV